MVEKFGIKLHFAPVAHPQRNGQVEVSNKTIKERIKKRLGKSKGKCPGELSNVLWSYRTTLRKETGERLYSHVYGTEALIPVEINYPSLRTQVYEPESNELGLRTNLNLLKERRERVELRRKTF